MNPPLSPLDADVSSAPPASPQPSGAPERPAPLWRGLLLGTLLVPVTCFVVAWAEIVLKTLQIGYLQMPPAVIGMLLLLLPFNALLRRGGPRVALSAQEMMIAYIMMVIAAMISSRGLMQKLIPLLVTPNYFASDTNNWGSLFISRLPQWLIPFDLQGPNKQLVSERFFERLRAGEAIPWQLWVAPLLWWSVLVLLVFGAFLCMAALLRRQWVDSEKLSFPLVQLPLEMVGAGDVREGSFLKNRLTWLGFAIPFTVFLIKGLHTWYPAVPDITMEWTLNEYLQQPPWNGIYYTPAKLSFAVIGFMFLLPSDLVFSLWFFFVLSRVQDVIARQFNMDMPSMPLYPTPLYRGYQAIGAYLVLAGYLLWVARPHLARIWRTVSGSERSVDDSRELLPYASAFWGFWVCALGAGAFLVAMGMSPLVAAMQLFGLFFVIALVMVRSTAEAGMLMTESSFRPIDLLRLVMPLHQLGPQNLTTLALSDTLLMRDQRALILSGFLDGLRISDGVGMNRRRLLPAFALAVLLAIVVAAVIQIWLPYSQGGITLYGYVYQANNRWGFEDYQKYFAPGALPVGWQGSTFLALGLFVTGVLVWGRANLAWFPFHPLGYALCSSWTMIVFWLSALIAWGIKVLLLRYGGMKLYRQARPFFLGMILGEFTAALLWAVANALLDTPVPPFPWA